MRRNQLSTAGRHLRGRSRTGSPPTASQQPPSTSNAAKRQRCPGMAYARRDSSADPQGASSARARADAHRRSDPNTIATTADRRARQAARVRPRAKPNSTAPPRRNRWSRRPAAAQPKGRPARDQQARTNGPPPHETATGAAGIAWVALLLSPCHRSQAADRRRPRPPSQRVTHRLGEAPAP